jgi:hypothetical protein
MTKRARTYAGHSIASELLRLGFESIDLEDCFIVSQKFSNEANLLVSIYPYDAPSPEGVKIDVVLGLQYPELQRTWNRLIEHHPEAPSSSWSILSSHSRRWCAALEREAWVLDESRGEGGTSVGMLVFSALQRFGLPSCVGLEEINALPAFCRREEADPLWSCDRSFVLPIALFMVGQREAAISAAQANLASLEAAPRKPNALYLDVYRRFASNIVAYR